MTRPAGDATRQPNGAHDQHCRAGPETESGD